MHDNWSYSDHAVHTGDTMQYIYHVGKYLGREDKKEYISIKAYVDVKKMNWEWSEGIP